MKLEEWKKLEQWCRDEKLRCMFTSKRDKDTGLLKAFISKPVTNTKIFNDAGYTPVVMRGQKHVQGNLHINN